MMGVTVETIIRLVAVFTPPAILVTVAVVQQPELRRRMAALLAGTSAFLGILVLNDVAGSLDWWSFEESGFTLLGQPIDLVISWAVLWGAVPTLVDRWPLTPTLATLAAIDLLTMPLVPGVALGSSWVVGEVVALIGVAAPAIVLGRLTAQRRHLKVRGMLQVLAAGVLLLVVVPLGGAALGTLRLTYDAVTWVGLQIAVVGAVIALTAVWEFYQRGQGTPWPWDPPRWVVTSGPYRYLSNPMQFGAVVLMLGQAIAYRSIWILGMAITGAAFAATNAALHENSVAAQRYGEAWRDYHDRVRPWLVRWRPQTSDEATLWVAHTCEVCRDFGEWLEGRAPRGLVIRPAELHPGRPLQRVTYVATDGWRTSGVDAFAQALEHLHAGWAMIGFLMRLPVVRSLARVIGDAVGLGPQELSTPASTASQEVTCGHPTLAND